MRNTEGAIEILFDTYGPKNTTEIFNTQKGFTCHFWHTLNMSAISHLLSISGGLGSALEVGEHLVDVFEGVPRVPVDDPAPEVSPSGAAGGRTSPAKGYI